jgi:hypothetical protein
VWAKPFESTTKGVTFTPRCAIALPDAVGLDVLSQIARVKPPYRLEGLQRNCAVPAKIDNISVLIWRHQLLSQPLFELHTAVGDAEAIKVKLINR